MPGAATMGGNILTALRDERERQGMSQSELARRLNASRGSFAMMENGHHSPTFARLMQWAAALNLTICIAHDTPETETPAR